MTDPLSTILAILHARSTLSTGLLAGGAWSVHVPAYAGLKCNALVRGAAWIAIDGAAPVHLYEGDCFLLAGGQAFTIASDPALAPQPAHDVFAGGADGIARWLLQRLRAERTGNEPASGAMADRLVDMLFIELMRSAFAAAFTQAVGMAPLAYLTRWRLQHAGHALRRDGVTVARAAEIAGFASDSAFGTAFRRVYGCSPGRYAARR